MFGAEWGYGGYGQYHFALVIAGVAWVVWQLRSGPG